MHYEFTKILQKYIVIEENYISLLKTLILYVSACEALSLYFCTSWWNPTRIPSSSSSIGLLNLSCTVPLSVICLISATHRLGTQTLNGTTTSCPYTNLNSVRHVNFLHVVLYAHSNVGIFTFQSSLFTLQIFVRAFSKILLKSSTIPFARG